MATLSPIELIGVVESFFAEGNRAHRDVLLNLLDNQMLKAIPYRPIQQYYTLHLEYEELLNQYSLIIDQLKKLQFQKKKSTADEGEKLEKEIKALQQELDKYPPLMATLQGKFNQLFTQWNREDTYSKSKVFKQTLEYLRAHYQSLATVDDGQQLTLAVVRNKRNHGLPVFQKLAKKGFMPAQHRIREANLISASPGIVDEDLIAPYVRAAKAGYYPSQIKAAKIYLQQIQISEKSLPSEFDGISQDTVIGWLKRGVQNAYVEAIDTTRNLVEDFIKKSSVLGQEQASEADKNHVKALGKIVFKIVQDSPELTRHLDVLLDPTLSNPTLTDPRVFKAAQKQAETVLQSYIESKEPSQALFDRYLLNAQFSEIQVRILKEIKRNISVMPNDIEKSRLKALKIAYISIDKLKQSDRPLEQSKRSVNNILQRLVTTLHETGINNSFKRFLNACAKFFGRPPFFKPQVDRFVKVLPPILTAYRTQKESLLSKGVEVAVGKDPAKDDHAARPHL